MINFAHEIRELTGYSEDMDWGRALPVPSCQSFHQAELEARSKMRRHRAFFAHDGRGVVVLRGTDLGCGCSVHRTQNASPDGRRKSEGISQDAHELVQREDPIRNALEYADATAPYLRDPPWDSPALPSRALWLRFHQVLTPELAMFDPAAGRVYYTLKMRRSDKPLDRTRVNLAAEAARGKREHGPGNLAPYTQEAVAEYGQDEARRKRAVQALGRRLARPLADVHDRYLQRELAAAAARLELAALAVYRRSHTRLRMVG